ncbi:DUF3139 domain-containing protein [Salirhabdus sp. Marseille-P4669]|uniref:DUF3139 domain-containing protein n=1 Tax=Salirhabdus sp. Marseille-P4669 TaxID=2042310 RepID=UPI000C7E3A0E|nr:DUF3139 domain-containing protein [Salirhabdus sp. Marseille-P4669]
MIDEQLLDAWFNKKSKSKKLFYWGLFSTCIISISLLLFFLLENNDQEPTFYENKVIQYLLEEQGYKEADITLLEERGTVGSLPPRYVIVVFQNEPYVEYTYYAHSQVKQASYHITDDKYVDFTEADLKNIDPGGFIK